MSKPFVSGLSSIRSGSSPIDNDAQPVQMLTATPSFTLSNGPLENENTNCCSAFAITFLPCLVQPTWQAVTSQAEVVDPKPAPKPSQTVGQHERTVTPRAEFVRPKPIATISRTVPPPDSSKYKNIIDWDDWKNPSVDYNSTNSPGFIVLVKVPSRKLFRASKGELLKALNALPATAWPYGRVLAVHGPSGAPGFPPETSFVNLEKAQEDEIKKAAKALHTEIIW